MQDVLDTPVPPAPSSGGAAVGGHRPTAAKVLPPGRDRFIPVSRYGLRAKLVAMLTETGGDAKAWGRALDCLAAWRHQDHRQRLLDLIENYLPFSPDSDTAYLIELDQAARDKARGAFIAGIEQLLLQANFIRLSADDVQRLLIERSPYGLQLHVDLTEFDEALLFYRGTGVVVREERNPWRLYLTKDRFEVPIFERLFLLFKLKPDETASPRSWRRPGPTGSAPRACCARRALNCRSACRPTTSTSRCSSASRRSISRCCSPTPRSRSTRSTSLS
jgi:hypothetical protein